MKACVLTLYPRYLYGVQVGIGTPARMSAPVPKTSGSPAWPIRAPERVEENIFFSVCEWLRAIPGLC